MQREHVENNEVLLVYLSESTNKLPQVWLLSLTGYVEVRARRSSSRSSACDLTVCRARAGHALTLARSIVEPHGHMTMLPKGFISWPKYIRVPMFHTVFARVYHCAISELCKRAKACNTAMESGTSPHVLRFTGFDHRRERRRLEYAFLTNAAATVSG